MLLSVTRGEISVYSLSKISNLAFEMMSEKQQARKEGPVFMFTSNKSE